MQILILLLIVRIDKRWLASTTSEYTIASLSVAYRHHLYSRQNYENGQLN